MNNIFKKLLNYGEMRKFKSIASSLNMDFHLYEMKKTRKDNVYEITDGLIYFYPLNDGFAKCNYKFYKDGIKVIGNDKEYSEISNLDDIVLMMVRIYSKSLDEGIVLNPYYFMLKLTDNICGSYHSKANLVITDKVIRNPFINKGDFDEERNYFINRFLDYFIGWNFGMLVNRNELLKSELEKLNDKVIDMGIRKIDISNYEEFKKLGSSVEYYELPTTKSKVKIK